MSEVAVAFPNDELAAGLVVSRLDVAGIRARIDRGLYGAFLTPQNGQITVVVDAKDERRAREILAMNERPRHGRRG